MQDYVGKYFDLVSGRTDCKLRGALNTSTVYTNSTVYDLKRRIGKLNTVCYKTDSMEFSSQSTKSRLLHISPRNRPRLFGRTSLTSFQFTRNNYTNREINGTKPLSDTKP